MSRSIEVICIAQDNQKKAATCKLPTPGLFLAVSHDHMAALANTPNTKQSGENCKVTSLSALHEIHNQDSRLPLYSQTGGGPLFHVDSTEQ